MADSKVKIYVNGESLDLFDNETIVLNRSIKEVQDVTKVMSDYSNTFIVPASETNNRIFQHYYNPAIINGYDNNVRVAARITLDGFQFKSGGISINSIKMEYNKAISYSITFYSKVANIKDIVGEDTLQDLDLSAYDHQYLIENVALGLTQGLYSEDVIYPMYSNYSNWTNSDPAITSGRYPWAICTNPADPTRPSWSGIRHYHLNPALSFPAIIDAIETDYGVTFSGSFFTSSNPDETSLVNDVYLWTSVDADNYVYDIRFNGWYSPILPPVWGTFPVPGTTYTKSTTNPVIGITSSITYNELDTDGIASILLNDVVIGTQPLPATSATVSVSFDIPLVDVTPIGSTLKLVCEFKEKKVKFNILNWAVHRKNSIPQTLFQMKTGGIESQFPLINMANEMPPLKLIDFINALIQMFNLVVDSEDGITYTFDKFRKYFNETPIDISDYVVYNQYDLKAIDNFNQISFSYESNIANTPQLFLNTYDRDFGDLTATLPSKSVNKLEINAPYSLPITEKLFNINTGAFEDVPILKNFKGIETGSIVLGTGSTFTYEPISEIEPSPSTMIFYKNNNIDISTYDIGMTDAPYTEQSNDYTNIQLTNMFECLPVRNFTDGTYSRYFSLGYSGDNEQYYGNILYGDASGYITGTNDTINQTMFDQNWFDYIGDIFDNRTKIYSFDAILPVSITNSINLSNVIIINARRFRINKLQVNLTNGSTKLELINIV